MRPRGTRRLFRFGLRSKDDVLRDVDDEFAFHLDMRTQDLVREGMSERDARAQALREFGNRKSGADGCAHEGDRLERRRRLAQVAGDMRQDVTVALRLLTRSPAFTTVAILTLALGIGANTAIFSALDVVLLRPLPYPAGDRLVQVYETMENGGQNSVSGGAYLDWRRHQTNFTAITLMGRVTYNLSGRGEPERLRGLEASHEFLQVLGVTPLLGRGFVEEDDRPGGQNNVVMLTEELWRSRFGADPSIVGRAIVLDEVPRTVIGILPAGAWLFREDTFVVPAVLEPDTPRARRAPHWAVVFGRLTPDANAGAAETELKAIKQQLASEYPSFKARWSVGLQPLPEIVAGPTRPMLMILLGAVALVLLIACANVANLLLARACNRQQELAVRAAIGATGGRIFRQVLTESVVLAGLGGAAGLAIALWGVHVLRLTIGDMLPPALAPRLDARVLAFAMLLTGATGVLFGVLPALRARRPDLNETLKNGGKSATTGGHRRTQSTLVVVEVALTVTLVASTGLLMRSLANTATVDPGFEPSRVLALDLSLPAPTYGAPEKRMAFSNTLLERVRALPGVDRAGAGMSVPFGGGGYGELFWIPSRPEMADRALGRVDFVSPGYLEALGARVLAGRTFAEADNRQDVRIAVVNETTVRTFFPGKNAIGERLIVSGDTWEIIGVIRDIVDRQLEAPHRPFAYVPQAFNPAYFSLLVRASSAPMPLVAGIRQEISRLDPGVAVANPRALDDAMARSLTTQRTVLSLVAAFAIGALALASLGLYGVMAYSVATRRREICIRMALGAVRRDVVRNVLGEGARLTLVGVAIGIAGAVGAAALLASELYHVRALDPAVIAGTVLSVAIVAMAACWLPAWRATGFDPIASLRND